MKKILCLLTAAGLTAAANAQDADPNRIYLGLNLKGGKLKENIALMPTGWIYKNALNNRTTKATIENDNSYGFDVQLGYFFGKKANWGISTGLLYLRNDGTLTIDSMHFEYRSTDFQEETFRQVVTTAAPIREELQTTNISIPVLVKYRTRFSKTIGLMVDAGIVYNAKLTSSYSASASFDYEAIYKFEQQGDKYVAVYDNSPVPHPDSWLMTVEEYIKDKGDGQQAAYLEKLNGQGYNVGLNKEAAASGEYTHRRGSIGFLIQPSLTFRLSDVFSLNVGPYYMVQDIKSERAHLRTMMTDKTGSYNTMLNNAALRRQHNYGANLGLNLAF